MGKILGNIPGMAFVCPVLLKRGLKKTNGKMTKIYVNKRRGVRVRKIVLVRTSETCLWCVHVTIRVFVKAQCNSSSATHTAAETESVRE